MAKVVGCPFVKKTYLDVNYKLYIFDPDLPSSDDNMWYLGFNENEVYYQHEFPKNHDVISLYFQDLNNTVHTWSALGTANQNEDGKNFNPACTFTNIAIAKRLVDFFCGSFSLDGECIYTNLQTPKYPPFNSEDKANKVNFRIQLFQNALNNEPILKIEELKEALKITSISNNNEDALYTSLSERETEKKYNDLNEKIENKEADVKNKFKI